ncbi:MAG: hypothetical protein NVSMB52_13190 [Chloroflexota bacterium]
MTGIVLVALLLGAGGTARRQGQSARHVGGTWEVLGAARYLPTFYKPTDLALDAHENIYVLDSGNRRVVKLSPHGHVLAQVGEGSASTIGKSVNPSSVTVDTQGSLYVGDAVHRHVAKFDRSGRLVGQWELAETNATIRGVVVRAGPRGNVVVVMVVSVTCPRDCAQYLVVQRRSPVGRILAVWRSVGYLVVQPPFRTGVRIRLHGVAVDANGNVYTASTLDDIHPSGCHCGGEARLVKFSPSGRELTFWDMGFDIGGPSLAVGAHGNIFASGSGHIEKLSQNGRQLATWMPFESGNINFGGTEPGGIVVDAIGSIYAADKYANRIVKLSSSGVRTALWGASGSGPGQYFDLGDVAIDGRNHAWVTDLEGQRITQLSPTGRVLSRWQVQSFGGVVAVDTPGNVYFAQWGSPPFIVRRSPGGRVLAILNQGYFIDPNGGFGRLAVDANGNILYITADDHGLGVLRVSPTGKVLAHLRPPVCSILGLALDARDNIYLTGTAGNPSSCNGTDADQILKLSPSGKVLSTWGGAADTSGRSPSFSGITVDRQRNVYVVDTANDRIQKLSATGTPLAVWGSSGFLPGRFHFAPHGHPTLTQLAIDSIAVDSQDRLIVTDTGNHRIQRFTP